MLLLSTAFHSVHLAVIFLNIFGWAVPRLRKISLLCQLITLSCWVGFGVIQGAWGYCPLTGWHYEVLRELGAGELPNNYISYIALYWFNFPLSADFAAGLILGCFSMALLVNITLLRKKVCL